MRVTADDGRIYLPADLRDRFGERFELIERGDRLLLVPIADDPLAALRAEAADGDESAAELNAGGLAEALEEAGR